MIDGGSLLGLLVTLIVAGLVCWLVWWLIGYVGLPEPFNKVARVIVAVIAVLFLVNVLLGMTGTPLFRWR